jgi:hypothetical protein
MQATSYGRWATKWHLSGFAPSHCLARLNCVTKSHNRCYRISVQNCACAIGAAWGVTAEHSLETVRVCANPFHEPRYPSHRRFCEVTRAYCASNFIVAQIALRHSATFRSNSLGERKIGLCFTTRRAPSGAMESMRCLVICFDTNDAVGDTNSNC